MKKLLSLTIVVLMLSASLVSVSAEEFSYGWNDDVFYLESLGLAFAVPAGAYVYTDEDIAELNEGLSSIDPETIFCLVVEDEGIFCAMGYKDMSDDPGMMDGYVNDYAGVMAESMEIEVADLVIFETSFFGLDAVELTCIVDEVSAVCFIVPTETGAFVFLLMAPEDNSEAVDSFMTELVSAMEAA